MENWKRHKYSLFESPWLRNGGVISGVGQSSDVLQNVRVHSLIDQNTNGWNYNLVNYYFDYDIVQEIIRTPIFHQVEEDALIWKAEKNGQYSVKSAYRLCVENIAENSHLHRVGSWDRIWRLKVPPKVKNLLWRICRGCLPTRARLLDKGVNCTSLCGLCDESYEDTIHVLFDCPRARNVWQQNLLWSNVYSVMLINNTAAEVIFALLRELSQDQSQLFASTLWSIWKSRNLRVWQNTSENSQTVFERAKYLLSNWQAANRKKQQGAAAATVSQPILGHRASAVSQSSSGHLAGAAAAAVSQSITTHSADTTGNDEQPRQIKWQKPNSGRLKCNVDASFSETANYVSFGICIRDDLGEFIKARTMWSHPIVYTDVGEALGLFHAIEWVHELQLSNVDFELDAKKVVDYFNGGRNDVSEFGAIVDDCRTKCNVYFENSKVEFSRRQANVVAHTLAREATSLASPHVFDDVPLCISTLIFNEKL
jgi:hypothetical protein